MGVESVTYITDFNTSNPVGGTDTVSTLDNHIRNMKIGILGTFPNFAGIAMTCTEAELNNLDGYTGNTNDLNILAGAAAAGVSAAELQYLNGVTSAIQTQLDAKLVAANNLSDLTNTTTARSNLGLAALAEVADVSSSELQAPATGTVLVASSLDEVTTASTSQVKVKEIYCPVAGTLSVIFDISNPGSQTTYGRIFVNGGAAGTLRSTTSTTYVTQTAEDITVSAGDLIQLYLSTSNAGNPAYCQAFKLRSDDSIYYVENNV